MSCVSFIPIISHISAHMNRLCVSHYFFTAAAATATVAAVVSSSLRSRFRFLVVRFSPSFAWCSMEPCSYQSHLARRFSVAFSVNILLLYR